MTKNKKKLRRAERRYSVGRAAQTLVLTGLLLAGGVGTALAATEINGAATWDASAATGDITYTGATGQKDAVSTSAANTAGTLGTLTITGTSDSAAALTAANDLTFNGAVSITGASGKLGSLSIDTGKTFTSGVTTTVGDYGKLTIAGTHVGALEATGANSAVIDLSGTQKGNVTLNGAGASLTAKDDKAAVWGDVIVTKGTLSTASNDLKIVGTDGTGLGNVTLGADSILTLGAAKTLTLGKLTVNKDTAVTGKLSLASLDGANKLTLNTGGDITVRDVDKNPLKVTLNQAGTTGLVLGNGGSLTAADLSLKGFNATDKAVTTATGVLALTANKLIMDAATTFGADATNKATTVTIRTKTGETVADFINQDITIKGYASNVGTLNLGDVDNTGSATTTKNITLAGKALAADAVMNVGYGAYTVNTINVGSATDVAAGGTGTITVANGGTLNATTVNLFGLTSEEATLALAATASKSQNANITTLNVGGASTFGAVTVEGAAAGFQSTLKVDTLNIGANGTVDITGFGRVETNTLNVGTGKITVTGNNGVSSSLNIEKDITLAAATFTDTAGAGKIALINNGRVWVHGKLTLKGADANEQTLATKGAVKVWSLDVVKADSSLGDVKVTGDGTVGQLSITAKNNTNVQTIVANAGQLWATDKGSIKFGEEHFNSAGTINANLKAGGADATANAGTVEVVGGSWKMAAGKTVDIVKGGTLTVGALDNGTFSPTNVDVSQGTLKVAVDATKAEVKQLSSLKLKLSDITTDYAALGSNINKAITNGGTLILTGLVGSDTNKTMNIGQVKTLTDAIMSGNGTVKLDGVNVTTDANTKLSDVASAKVSLETAVVQADAMTSGSAVVGGLHGATTTTTVTTANLTLTGQGNTGGQLITGTAGQTGIELDNASTLTLGNAAASTAGSGTLTGNVTIGNTTAGSIINAVNGSYKVTGNITGGNKGDTINVVGANLSANEITTGGTVASTINVTGGSLNAKKLTTTSVDTVTVNGGSLNVGEIVAATGGTINVGTSAAAGTLTADKMTLAGATLFLDPSWIAGQEYQDAGTASRAAITAFAAGIDGDVVVGKNAQLSLGTKNVEQLSAAIRQMGNVWGSSGITAALGIYSPQTLAATGAIDVNGGLTATSNPTVKSANFADKSLLVVSATGVGSGVALTGTNLTTGTDSKLTVNAGAKLHILGGKAGETVNIVAGFKETNSAIAAGGWAGANLTTDTALLTAKAGTAFTAASGAYSVILNQNAATSIFPKLSTSMGGLVDTIVRDHGVDTMSNNTGIRFVSRAVSNSYIGTNDATQAAATIEGAAQLAVVGAAPAMTISAATAATTAATTRTSFATPLMDSTKAVALHQGTDGSLSLDSGLSAGDSMKTGLGVWIMPLYQSNNVWGMKAENFKGGYTSDLGGVALGADYTIDDSLRFGLAFNLGGGYAQSTGDFNSTDNSFNFWGINLYGGWTQNNFGISGDVGYTSTYNKMKQELPSAMQMDDIKSDVTSRAWTAGLRGEYKFATEALDIIPHVGVRYLGLTTDSYKAKSDGGTVFKADEQFQNIWTFPVGVTFAKEITNASGWSFRPQLDLGVTPAAGDVQAKSRVRIPNVDGAAEMKMQVVDYLSYDGGLGLEMKKDNVSFGVNYNIQASEHRTGHGVFGTFRYEF